MKKLYYLATPYSHEDRKIVEKRYEDARDAAHKLTMLGYLLIEPIGMSHDKARVWDLPKGYEYWKERDRAYIDHCQGVIVYTMDGWDKSVGVKDEITYAATEGKEVIYISPEELEKRFKAIS